MRDELPSARRCLNFTSLSVTLGQEDQDQAPNRPVCEIFRPSLSRHTLVVICVMRSCNLYSEIHERVSESVHSLGVLARLTFPCDSQGPSDLPILRTQCACWNLCRCPGHEDNPCVDGHNCSAASKGRNWPHTPTSSEAPSRPERDLAGVSADRRPCLARAHARVRSHV